MLDLGLSGVLAVTGAYETFPWCASRYVSWLVDADVDWCKIAKPVQKIENPIFKFDKKYFEFLKTASEPMFESQVWASTLVPVLGSLASTEAGTVYHRLSLSYSVALIPGGGARPPLNFLQTLLDKIPWLKAKMTPKPDETKKANIFMDRRIGLP